MNSRNIEMAISSQNVKDQVAAFLYSIGVVQDNESVEFDLPLPEVIPLKLKINREAKLELVKHGT